MQLLRKIVPSTNTRTTRYRRVEELALSKINIIMSRFDGQIIIITGASSGIGRQAAIDFSNNGASSVVLVSRSELQLREVAALMNPKCNAVVYPCDISNKLDVIKMSEDLLTRFDHIDILVNNAGFGIFGKVQNQSIEEMESVTATNYFGMIYCTKAFLDSMLRRKSGHIVNVASVAASFGVPGLAAYCGSKFATLGFSEALHHELYGSGVGITAVSPIAVNTNFFRNQSFGGKMPNYTRLSLEPKTVSRAIMAAANSSRLEIIVPFFVRGGVWLKHTLPYFVNAIAGPVFRRQYTN